MTKEQFPKSHSLLAQYMMKQLNMHSKAAEIQAVIPAETMADIAMSTEGDILTKFLDDHQLYTGVWCLGKDIWKWRIDDQLVPMESSASSRKEAQSKVYEEGFKRLEKLI